MIDRSIQYMPVMMIKRDVNNYPEYKLPPGYTFDFYNPDTGFEDWKRVQLTSNQIEKPEGIDGLFKSEFMDRPDWLSERMLFVRDSSGAPVATATLWYGAPFGSEIERVHWVATDDMHQGRGLCRAMLTRLFERYSELGLKTEIYLISQTFSYPAISIYQRFGFARYTGPEPCGWHVDNFERTAQAAWALIDSKLAARGAARR